jgi:hypothetical protein
MVLKYTGLGLVEERTCIKVKSATTTVEDEAVVLAEDQTISAAVEYSRGTTAGPAQNNGRRAGVLKLLHHGRRKKNKPSLVEQATSIANSVKDLAAMNINQSKESLYLPKVVVKKRAFTLMNYMCLAIVTDATKTIDCYSFARNGQV